MPLTETDHPDWRPAATLEALRLRARIIQRLRAWLDRHGALEVETPVLSACATTDVHLQSLATRYTGPGAPGGRTLYLHTSPEFPMKRLLAAGSGAIYQLCKVFRDGEAGRLHNPEFTMLEWYELDCDHHTLMELLAELVGVALAGHAPLASPEKLSYRDAFLHYAGVDPFADSAANLIAWADQRKILPPGAANTMDAGDIDAWRDLVLTHGVEPHLGRGRLTFLYDYPASQAALARVRQGSPPLAERFELYLEGIELANGFHELADAREQARRFDDDIDRRRAQRLEVVPRDERLLAALDHGLPESAGVALGVDRLVMLAAGERDIGAVISFPFGRA